MNKRFALLLTLSLTIAAGLSTAHAFPVVDIANLVQNTLAAAQQIEEIQHQVEQIRNQNRSLQNQAKHLRKLDFSSLKDIQRSARRINRLLNRATGIAYEVEQSRQQFEQLYPKEYAEAQSRSRVARDASRQWELSLDSLEESIRVQSQAVENVPDDVEVMSTLVNRSQAAEGGLQASQVTNQLLALQVQQSMQAQQVRIAQDRAMALEQARVLGARERARQVRQSFMTSTTRYRPEEVVIARN